MPTLEQQRRRETTPYNALEGYLKGTQPDSPKLVALADYTKFLNLYTAQYLNPTPQGKETLERVMTSMADKKEADSGYALALGKIVDKFDKLLFVYEATQLGNPHAKPGSKEGAEIYAQVANRLKVQVNGKRNI